MSEPGPDAADVLAALRERGLTLATAESLTGGLVGARLTAVAGSSDVYRGGVVCYATDLKATLARVPADLLAEHGPVSREAAAALATGVAHACRADVGLATTGVAGPTPQDGHAVGEVYVALSGPGRVEVRVQRLGLHGTRAAIRQATVDSALSWLAEMLAETAR